MKRPRTISAIVLAGGQGQRVGGQDKGLLHWHDKPLVEHVIERVAPQVDELHISANRNLDAYGRLGYPVHSDCSSDFRGPLAGLAACFPHCTGDWVLVAPCDCPQLPENLASRLYATVQRDQLDASYAHDDARAHYLCLLIRKTALAGLPDRLNGPDLSVKGWLGTLRCKATAFSGKNEAFQNINALESKRR